jgi:hypothetical protein
MAFIWWLTVFATLFLGTITESPAFGLLCGVFLFGVLIGLRWFVGSLRQVR